MEAESRGAGFKRAGSPDNNGKSSNGDTSQCTPPGIRWRNAGQRESAIQTLQGKFDKQQNERQGRRAERDRLAPRHQVWQVAECTRTLAKGSYVMVQGTVRTREFERDGVRQRIPDLRANSVRKLD